MKSQKRGSRRVTRRWQRETCVDLESCCMRVCFIPMETETIPKRCIISYWDCPSRIWMRGQKLQSGWPRIRRFLIKLVAHVVQVTRRLQKLCDLFVGASIDRGMVSLL